ncbi:hypothetical protein ACFQ2B_31315 [Streptomyces stramineus]
MMFPLPQKDSPEGDDPWEQYERAFREQSRAEQRTREIFLGLRPDNEQTRAQYGKCVKEGAERRSRIWRRFVMRAWLVPMMVASVGDKHRDQAKERLRLWLGHLEPEHSPRTGPTCPSPSKSPSPRGSRAPPTAAGGTRRRTTRPGSSSSRRRRTCSPTRASGTRR